MLYSMLVSILFPFGVSLYVCVLLVAVIDFMNMHTFLVNFEKNCFSRTKLFKKITHHLVCCQRLEVFSNSPNNNCLASDTSSVFMWVSGNFRILFDWFSLTFITFFQFLELKLITNNFLKLHMFFIEIMAMLLI